jgi:hypothetical protein
LAIDHLVLIVYKGSEIEVDKFQPKVPADNKGFRLDVPVDDKEIVKTRDALDEASADLNDIPTLARCEGDDMTQFWENGPQPRLCLKRPV